MHDFLAWLSAWVAATFGPNPDYKQVLLTIMTPIFLLAVGIEWWVQTRIRKRTQDYYWKDTLVNVALGTGYQIAEATTWLLFTGAIMLWVYQYRLFDIPVNAWTAVPIFLLVEFCYYWFHRASHRIRWFWTAHVTHHAGEHMNMTMASRQSVINAFIGIWIFYIPPVLLGVHPAMVFLMLAINLAYQFFIHTNSIPKLPRWIEYVFDTPSNHRAHHGKQPKYIDRNYGGVLIVFDRLFGTYVEETEPPIYGIPTPPNSYNFFVLNFHELIAMWRDFMKPGPWRWRWKHLWGPPEWERPNSSTQ
jgi:sterol desaturase/sphingolipid hydroxylase (fatty acid hydroxylase superfamily)